MSTFTKGQTVYNNHGHVGEFILKDGVEFIVREMYETDEGTRIGEVAAWNKCFSEPPKPILEAKITDLESRFEMTTEKHRELLNLLSKTEADYKIRMGKFSKLAVLEKLEQFIDGKITHYFCKDYYNGDILEVSKCYSDEDKYDEKFKLLSLSVKSLRDTTLAWTLSQYSDGSGSETEVIPCCSLEEATGLLNAWLETRWNEWRKDKGMGNIRRACEQALKFKLPVPIDIRAFIKEQDSQSAARAVSDAQSRLNEAKTKLEAVKA